MAKAVLTDVRTFLGGADLTGNTNKVQISSECEEKGTTNYGSGGWHECVGGLYDTSIDAAGQWEAGDASKVDNATYAGIATVAPWTIVPTSGTAGSLAYLTKSLQTSYTAPQGGIGDVAEWSVKAVGNWPTARGAVAHPAGTPRTTSGTGTSVQLGAVAAGQYLYANIHVLSVSGTSTPTITGRIESDDNSGFTSATTRLTFAAATAISGEASRVAGPFTDTYWRAAWTISGTTPSFLFAISFGIR